MTVRFCGTWQGPQLQRAPEGTQGRQCPKRNKRRRPRACDVEAARPQCVKVGCYFCFGWKQTPPGGRAGAGARGPPRAGFVSVSVPGCPARSGLSRLLFAELPRCFLPGCRVLSRILLSVAWLEGVAPWSPWGEAVAGVAAIHSPGPAPLLERPRGAGASSENSFLFDR